MAVGTPAIDAQRAAHARTAQPWGPRFVSSAHGPLRRLLLHFPREAIKRRGYRAGYASLFASLPSTTRLTVLVHPAATEDLDEVLAESGRGSTTTVVHTDENLRFTVWAQDPCLVLQDDDGQTTLLAAAQFDRKRDADTLDVLATGIGARVQPSPLVFHGGDVLTGDDFVLVGQTARDLSGHALDDGRHVVVVDTGKTLGNHRTRRIRVKGRDLLEMLPGGDGSPDPLMHLDMFLTLAGRGPTGRYRIMVGSLTLADEILERPPVDATLADHLDDIATQLVDEGFEVLRNPLPLTHGDGRRELDGDVHDVRIWYLASANNCLVQVDAEHGDHVWLPTYGHGAWRELAATDAANRRIWQTLGFTVHELTSFHTFAQRFGALHCIAKELDRGALGPS